MEPRSAPLSDLATPVISLVVPMLNEAEMVPIIVERLTQVLEDIGEAFEVIFVNDGSTDETAPLLDAAHAADDRVKILHLSRNFGKELALTAGFDFAKGEAVNRRARIAGVA